MNWVGGFRTAAGLAAVVLEKLCRDPAAAASAAAAAAAALLVMCCAVRWLATAGGMVVMVLLGEWFCVRREMQDIPLSECG